MLNWLLAAASGAMMALAFPPFDLSWLAPLSLAPLLVALDCEPRPARRFLLGYAAGVIFWAGTCHWIHYPLAVHGNLAPAVAWGAVALLALIKGLHTGFFGLLASGLLSSRWAALAIPALWVSIERTHGPLGFAWLALGNAGIDMEIPPRAAPFTGV
ncbi:MAG: apolipoprotein N-acyltransferase, partial [Bryobacteraceae bacterium]